MDIRKFSFRHSSGMLSPVFSDMSQTQWSSMPSDTNGVEALNKYFIDHSKRAKTLEACLEFTYCQDKKTTLEHLYAFTGLLLSYKRCTIEKCKLRAERQNKARCKMTQHKSKEQHDEDDVGLKGTST